MPLSGAREHHILPSFDGGRWLLFDVERGVVFPLPDGIEEGLRPEDMDEEAVHCYSMLKETLLPANEDMEQGIKGRADQKPPPATHLSLDLAGSCNLRCLYCFENDLDSRHGKPDPKVLRSALRNFFGQLPAGGIAHIHFGSGEPLLGFNRLQEVVGETMRLAGSREVRFHLTTNGTLVNDEIAEFLSAHPFHVKVSMDGPPEHQNANRPKPHNASSYDEAYAGLQKLLSRMPERVTINSVLTAGQRLIDLWRWAEEIGIHHLQVIKVGAPAGQEMQLPGEMLHAYQHDLHTIAEETARSLAGNRQPVIFQPLAKVVAAIATGRRNERYCGAGGDYLGVDVKGDVWPCFHYIGLEEYRLGNINNAWQGRKRQHYFNRHATPVDQRPVCSQCWARYLCGGGCYADAAIYGQDTDSPFMHHCDFWRSEFEAGLALYEMLIRMGPQYVLALMGIRESELLATIAG